MGRSKFRQAPLRERPKHSKGDSRVSKPVSKSFSAWSGDLFSGLAALLSPLFLVLPVVLIGVYVAALSERSKCTMCSLPAGDCKSITTGMWDSRSFKPETYAPFAGRFNGETVFETSDITCKTTGMSCEWKSGEFGAHSSSRSLIVLPILDGWSDIWLTRSCRATLF